MRRVIIESPYRGRGRWLWQRWLDRLRNIRYARRCVKDSLARGEAPIASHLLLAHLGILDDDKPAERAQGIDAGHAWLPVCDAVAYYKDRGFTHGMKISLDRASKEGKTIVYRRIRK